MNMCKSFIISLLLTLIFACSLSASYTLENVIEADKSQGIANETPSLLISEMSGKFLTINGKYYQIRQFAFETKPLEDSEKKDLTFAQVIEKYDQRSVPAKQAPRVLHPVDYFMSTPQMEQAGFYYLLSLREVPSP